jgi:hypothetical protein
MEELKITGVHTLFAAGAKAVDVTNVRYCQIS